ncbi:hypothetical protein ACNTMW_26065 [Planosporangium sp. 12N6]|uniref:hypothetical protein n=1 Tax=Planosporangium spinosum TaxID=3402278 RepID=UPI003CF6DEC1
MRALVLLLAAVCGVLEAAAVGGAMYVLGEVIDAYSMSMGGLPAAHGRLAVWLAGAVLAAVLAAPAVPLAVAAVRGRPFGRVARGLIVAALVIQAVLGLAVAGAAGGLALLAVLAPFSLLLWSLVTSGAPRRSAARVA